MKITPKMLKKSGACSDGVAWGLKEIGKGMALEKLLPKFRRADWMLWALQKEGRLTKAQFARLAVICAESVLDIFERKYPDDNRPRLAIEAAVRYAESPTEANRVAACAAASYAACAADAAYAYAASYSAYAAADAAYAACAASNAASAASYAAYAAYAYARMKHHAKLCRLIRAELKKFNGRPQ